MILEKILNDPHHLKREKPETPKKLTPDEQLELMQKFLPDADLSFLASKLQELNFNAILINTYINHAMEKRDYPTMDEYLKKQKLSAQIRKYTTEFNVENFVELIPNPENHFHNHQTYELDYQCKDYIIQCFTNKFYKIYKSTIQSILNENNFNIIESNKKLENTNTLKKVVMKTKLKQQNVTALLQFLTISLSCKKWHMLCTKPKLTLTSRISRREKKRRNNMLWLMAP